MLGHHGSCSIGPVCPTACIQPSTEPFLQPEWMLMYEALINIFGIYWVRQFSGATVYGVGCAQTTSDPKKLRDTVLLLSWINAEWLISICQIFFVLSELQAIRGQTEGKILILTWWSWRKPSIVSSPPFMPKLSLTTCHHGCQMAKFDPFLSLDCARVEGVGAQSKERKGSNFAA